MRKFFLVTVGLLATQMVFGQMYLLPYLADGKYGVADTSGQIIIQPKYEAVVTAEGVHLISVKQNGLWGVVNLKDEILLPITIDDTKSRKKLQFGAGGPEISLAVLNNTDLDRQLQPYLNTHLTRIHDDAKDIYYFINPFVPQVTYPGWTKQMDVSYLSSVGLLKVEGRDKKINFIDTSGRAILEEGVFYGHVVSSNAIVVENDQKLKALFNIGGEAITSYKYKAIHRTSHLDFILAERVDALSGGKILYTLFDAFGKVLLEDYPYKIKVIGSRAILSSETGSALLDPSGMVVYENQNACILQAFLRDDVFILDSLNVYGFLSQDGEIIQTPQFDFLEPSMRGDWLFKRGQSIGVLDSLFQVRWSLDSMGHITNGGFNGDYIMVERVEGEKKRGGIIDLEGHMILEPEYSSIYHEPASDWIKVSRDSTYGLFDLKGHPLLPLSDSVISLTNFAIPQKCDDEKKIYYNPREKMRLHPPKSPRVKETIINDKEWLTDCNGAVVSSSGYNYIREYKGLQIDRALFHCLSGESLWEDVINETGKSILPSGYGVYVSKEEYTSGGLVKVYEIGNSGPFLELFDFDSAKSGVIDASGNWIISPDKSRKEMIDSLFIWTQSAGSLEIHVYDQNGKLVARNPFSYVSHRYHSNIEHDRLILGRPDDWRSYYRFLKKSTDPISGEIEHEASEQLNGMALKGSVDHTGQIVIPFQFESIGEFEHTYTVATKKDKKGKAYSVIIDLDGNEIVKTPYELIYLLNSDSTLIAFKENEKWGIMELNGKVLVQPHYQEVDKIPELDMFKLEDVDSTFLAPCSNPKELKAIGPAGNFEIHQVGDIMFTSITVNREKNKQYYFTFGGAGIPMQAFEGFGFSTRHMGRRLPSGYISLRETAQGLPYLMNIKTGRVFKD